MQVPDKRLSLIVGLHHVFTLRTVLKALSTVHDIAGRVSAIRKALRTAETEWFHSQARSFFGSYHRVAYASSHYTMLEVFLKSCQCSTFH